MRLASLFENRYFENFALSTCAERHVETISFSNLTTFLAAMQRETFDAVILEDSAREVGHWLSALKLSFGNSTPIIVFGEGSKLGISRALQRGADDYASHCAGPSGLLSRIEARISLQLNKYKATQLHAGAYSLDIQTQCMRSDTNEISLTSREFSLAWMLFENLGQVVTFKMLSVEIWGHAGDIGKRTIEQHVYKLRRKFIDMTIVNNDIPCIQTVYGVGYRLVLPAPICAELQEDDKLVNIFQIAKATPILAEA